MRYTKKKHFFTKTRKSYNGGVNFKTLLATTATLSSIPFVQTNKPIDTLVPFEQSSEAMSLLHPDEVMFLESNFMPVFTNNKNQKHAKFHTLKSKKISELSTEIVAKPIDDSYDDNNDDYNHEHGWMISFKKVNEIYDAIKKSIIDHELSDETIEWINNIKNAKEYEWKSYVTKKENDYTYVIAPTVKTYGAMNHIIKVIEATLFTETKTAGWHFMHILKKIHKFTKKHINDGITNKNLITILEFIKQILSTMLATDESDIKKVIKFVFQRSGYSTSLLKHTYINLTSVLLDNMMDRTSRKNLNKTLKETLFSVTWGITIVKYYDAIEERKAAAYMLRNLESTVS